MTRRPPRSTRTATPFPDTTLFLSLLTAYLSPLTAMARAQDQALDKARRILRAAPLVDGHNDLPWTIREDSATPRDVEAYDLRQRTRGHTDQIGRAHV